MRYIDLTLEQDNETTYNGFQVVAGIITSAAIVGTLVYGTLSLITSL